MPLADDVPLEHAALLGCAALTGVGAVLNAARPEPGFTALVIGAGGVGQFVVQGARIAGAAEILVVDPVEARREQALGLGATRACAPDDLREAMKELDPEGVDYAFDAVGAPATTKLALRWTRGGGTAVVVGLPAGGEKLELDPFEFSNREKTLTGTIYGSEDPAVALPQLIDLVRVAADSSSRASSAPRSRSTAPTTRSRPASRANPAACSSRRSSAGSDSRGSGAGSARGCRRAGRRPSRGCGAPLERRVVLRPRRALDRRSHREPGRHQTVGRRRAGHQLVEPLRPVAPEADTIRPDDLDGVLEVIDRPLDRAPLRVDRDRVQHQAEDPVTAGQRTQLLVGEVARVSLTARQPACVTQTRPA